MSGQSLESRTAKSCLKPSPSRAINPVKLKEELEWLKRQTGLGLDLNVVWAPGADKALLGEVKGRVIYLYVECGERALETLFHEYLDYCVSQAIEPYRMVTNDLIKLLNRVSYERKEEVVGALCRLFEGKRHEN
ncbi:MAG: hypothetical protein Q8O47_03800 [Candidatus Bathyarchaeota archaeon]|jgi:hypothetical protein|nr:hypothetical protein [Candidatus Bathyarchaeota archaeon]